MLLLPHFWGPLLERSCYGNPNGVRCIDTGTEVVDLAGKGSIQQILFFFLQNIHCYSSLKILKIGIFGGAFFRQNAALPFDSRSIFHL